MRGLLQSGVGDVGALPDRFHGGRRNSSNLMVGGDGSPYT